MCSLSLFRVYIAFRLKRRVQLYPLKHASVLFKRETGKMNLFCYASVEVFNFLENLVCGSLNDLRCVYRHLSHVSCFRPFVAEVMSNRHFLGIVHAVVSICHAFRA